ncbi:MAG: threonine--tRNA ligase [Bdellovibrionales bacterium]|nr:threonine--tRNA ligase [Bdellovibrionales bacterium]
MIEAQAAGKPVTLDPQAVTGLDAVKALRDSKLYVGMKVDGELRDLMMPLPKTGKVEFVPADSAEGVDVIRHSTAHVMAQAVKALYPDVQVTIGPVIENGFFYDFVRKGGFKEEELPIIEKKMEEIIKARYPVRREEWDVEKACTYFAKIGESYKVEIIRDIAKDTGAKTVSVYWQGEDFVDLCRGPHIPTTGHIPAFKLMAVAGAYWRGDEKNEMLARIYGTAWGSKDALKAYLHQLEEAKKRDHRKLGNDLDLFSFHPEAPASPFFHPNGALVYAQLQEYLRKINRENGFQEVITPLLMSQDLWKLSGHYDNYRENMYFTQVDERAFALKPMNCPGHCLVFRSGHHSYRDLPLRLAEFGRVHRHERSGVTAGLFRVRSFCQDDAHVYCTVEQIEAEILRVLKMIRRFYTALDFTYHVELSTRPAKRIGEDAVWDQAEAALESALKSAGETFKLNPGDGAFYGPKIDFHLKDSIGRTHQCGTIQLDFMMPGRFGLEYAGSDNTKHTPVMIHRAIAGSMERFMGVYIEHVAGNFPFWIAPTQVGVITIVDEAKPFAEEVCAALREQGFRFSLDDSADKLGAKVRRFQNLKVPVMLIIGGREAAERVVSVRLQNGEQRQGVNLETLIKDFQARNDPAFKEPAKAQV